MTALLARQAVRDQADAGPGVEPRVERPKAGRLRSRRQVEPEEGEREVEQAPRRALSEGIRPASDRGASVAAASSRPAPPRIFARVALEAREAAVRVPDHEGRDTRGAGEDVRWGRA